MEHFETTLSSRTVFDGRLLTFKEDEVRLENGSTAIREYVEHSGGVAVLAIDDDENILMVRQFRYPFREVVWELPAGKLDKGEDPAECGRRELREETGYTCSEYIPLTQAYPTPGYTDERLYLYLARKLEYTGQHLDEDEFLTVQKLPYKTALEMCLNGEIKDAKTLIAILFYNTFKNTLTI